MIAAFTILLITILVKVEYDYCLWMQGKGVNHALEIATCIIPVAVSVYFLSLHCDYATAFFLCASFFMFLFNGLYNLKRKYNWWFIGTQDSNDSTTEKFFRLIGMPATIMLQIMLVSASTILYIINYKL